MIQLRLRQGESGNVLVVPMYFLEIQENNEYKRQRNYKGRFQQFLIILYFDFKNGHKIHHWGDDHKF
jgi:hypothetical protein